MRNRRDRRGPNKLVFHITIRTLHGLPFVARQYMNMVLWGIISRGQELFPVQIVAIKVMANHLHIILAGQANLVSPFMNYIDGEIAQAVKRIFPQLYQGNVWQGRPKEQVLHTPEDVLQKLAYLYANATRAQQVNSIDEYQGVSTWKMFQSGSHQREHPWIRRVMLKALDKNFSTSDEKRLISTWKKRAQHKHTLKLSPYVWRRYFAESRGWTKEEIYNKVTSRVRELEAEALAQRKSKQAILVASSFNDPQVQYKPKKNTPTPFVQCSLPDMRRQYIEGYREFCFQLRSAARHLRKGLLKLPKHLSQIPPGGYLPGGVLSSVLLYAVFPSG
jgi:REP element-mobilizing transposase RayT